MMDNLKALIKRTGIPSEFVINMVKTVMGTVFFYIFPRKTIVLIVSSMRAGSTLLKALLAEAPDVSNLPEFNFNAYAKYNKFRFYFEFS